MQRFFRRPQGRAGWVRVGGVAVALVALVVVATAVYLLGGGGSNGKATSTGSVATLAPSKNGTIFTIDSSSSQASFTLGEVLFGNHNTVVGKTNQVTGQISVDRQDPAQSQLGQIRVDLSTLATDNDLRNRTLHSRILETDQAGNQFATFMPTALRGLPATVVVGQPFSFQAVGNLTIHGVTRPATFDVQVTPQSETSLTGTAQTTIKYQDFNIAIPDVPSVTGVDATVTLALTFSAHA